MKNISRSMISMRFDGAIIALGNQSFSYDEKAHISLFAVMAQLENYSKIKISNIENNFKIV